jgi:Ca2+-binding EF-hand superfamily protein
MRGYLSAIGVVCLCATMSAAQVPRNPAAKADAKAVNPAVPGRPAADAKRDADVKRPGDAAAPQANAMFAAMDADGDGVISKLELRKAIKALKTLDNDGSITLAEASVGGPSAIAGGVAADDPQVAQLMSMDRNRDNKLTANEVPPAMQQMVGAADQDRNGEITREEIAAAVANTRNRFGAGSWQGGPGGARGPNGAGLDDTEQAMGQFLQHDKDGDGKVTERELPPQMRRAMQADQNKNGELDAGEMQAWIAQQGGKARALRGGIDPDARGRKN